KIKREADGGVVAEGILALYDRLRTQQGTVGGVAGLGGEDEFGGGGGADHDVARGGVGEGAAGEKDGDGLGLVVGQVGEGRETIEGRCGKRPYQVGGAGAAGGGDGGSVV